MGCDIHSVIQVRETWRKQFGEEQWTTKILDVGDHRDYNTFAVYADVRNGRGFAGCDTGEGWTPIDEPRGLPSGFQVSEDCHHQGVKVRNEKYDCDEYVGGQWMGEHSYSWLTLAEMEAKWSELVGMLYEEHGILDRKHYYKTVAVGKEPSEWSGGVWGGATEVVVQHDLRVKMPYPEDAFTHVQCKWKRSAQSCLHTMKGHMALMRGVAEAEGFTPEEVRIVFGFDS